MSVNGTPLVKGLLSVCTYPVNKGEQIGLRPVNDIPFMKTLAALTIRQRIIAAVATAAVIFGLWGMTNIVTREGEALLFSGLDAAAAGEIVAALDGLGTPYTVKGSAIYVPESQRDRLRLDMAREGLPATSSSGYEILDSLNGFSTTADMFDAAYWRAKEGELTRTILSMPQVKAARVHLGVTRQSAFRRANDDKSASVTIESPSGLTADQARSIQYLTALAVPELSPEQVAVIDTSRGVLAGPGARTGLDGNGEEQDRAAALEDRLTRMLEAHVGAGNAKVSVAVDLDRQQVEQTERVVDPTSRQIAARRTSEELSRNVDGGIGGPVTVASNLPDGDAAAPADEEDATSVVSTSKNEDVTYTGTEIERRTAQLPGAIRRLSVAVLLNERFTVAEDGTRTVDPRTPEELAALEALVAGAAGTDAERGDSVTVRILPFEAAPAEALVENPGFVEQHVLPRSVELAQMVFLGLIVLVVGLFVLRPALTPRETLSATTYADGTPQVAAPVDAASLLTMLTGDNPDEAAAILDAWFEEEEQAQAA